MWLLVIIIHCSYHLQWTVAELCTLSGGSIRMSSWRKCVPLEVTSRGWMELRDWLVAMTATQPWLETSFLRMSLTTAKFIQICISTKCNTPVHTSNYFIFFNRKISLFFYQHCSTCIYVFEKHICLKTDMLAYIYFLKQYDTTQCLKDNERVKKYFFRKCYVTSTCITELHHPCTSYMYSKFLQNIHISKSRWFWWRLHSCSLKIVI